METFDVVIIGSGAGGAPVAHELVARGKKVLVLEKGPLMLTQYQSPNGLSEFKRDELFATGQEKIINHPTAANNGQSYFSSHVEPDLNDEPHVYRNKQGKDEVTIEGYTAQVVGGGTQLYGAVSLRFTETDFRLGTFNRGRASLKADPGDLVRDLALDWPITYQDLEPFYVKAEALIGINGEKRGQLKPFSADSYQTPLTPNPISKYAHAGMTRLGAQLATQAGPVLPYRTPLAVITQDHAPSGRKRSDPRTGFVNRYGDPLGLKSSTWVALLAPMMGKPGFELRPNCTVTHLSSEGDRVTTVHYRDPLGRKRQVQGAAVVVACSAIESVRLLMLSAELDPQFQQRIDGNGLLGRYFLTHCFGGAETVMPDRADKSLSLDSDWAIDCCASEEFLKLHGLWAGGAIYNNTSDQALPLSMARTHGSQDLDTIWKGFIDDSGLTGEKLLQFLDVNFGRRLSVSFMANQVPDPENRISLHGSIKDKWGRPAAYVTKQWHAHDQVLMMTIAERCAEILRWGGDPLNGRWEVEGFGGVHLADNALARIANHILGGARFGTDPAKTVLDRNNKAWRFENLYVTDGSFMPTSGGANPTLTIQANAFRVGEILSGRV